MRVETSSESPGVADWIASRGVAETIVCAIAFLADVSTLGFQFVYDDKPQIIENPAIHAWRYFPHYFTTHAWAELYPNVAGNYYRPLFLLWLRFNHAIFGVSPQGWHLTSVLCHVAATYLVFVLVAHLAANRWTAFNAATLFALHPVHMESVAWVSGVTDPLMAIFLVGSFLAYLRSREQYRWMALALALFVLGLLEKETTVILGPLIFVYAFLYAGGGSWISRLALASKQSFPFLFLIFLYLALRAHVLHGLSHTVTPITWKTMALTEPSVLWLYVRHLLFPFGLSGLYGLPYVQDPASPGFLVPAGLLLTTVVAAGWAISRLKEARLAVFACCWIALPIIPVLFLRAYAEGDIAHDRYLYLPSIGFVLLVSLFIAGITGRPPARRNLQMAALAIVGSVYAFGTATQQFYWASDLNLYSRAYKIAPRDNLICNDLGTALMDAGNSRDAIALYTQVLSRQPEFWLSNYNLGYAYYKIGRFADAEMFLKRAVTINSADSDEFLYLGLSVWRQGRTEEAVQDIQRAIEIRPSAPGYHFASAMLHRDQNDIPAAKSELKLELHYHPESTTARQQLNALTNGPP